MIKQIIKCLKENNEVSSWLINEVELTTTEAFYVLHHLETTRITNTLEYHVTVYKDFTIDGSRYLGSSSFIISHRLKKQEITKLINDALVAAGFVKNKYYELVKPEVKKTFKEKDISDDNYAIIEKIAQIYFDASNENVKFNSLEIFNNKVKRHVVNSLGVDLKNVRNNINVEAIPSYNGEKENVELYKMAHYEVIDLEKIKSDAISFVNDVTDRYNATKIKDVKNIDVILKDEEVLNFFSAIIEDYSYRGIYKGSTDKKIGSLIQTDIKNDSLTLSLVKSSKADMFDNSGLLYTDVTIIDNGKLVNYYGDNQYAYYLGMKPTGYLHKIKVDKGSTSIKKQVKNAHLEIIALSGIQIDMYSNYVGGEVRLAKYFDGKDYYPVSGFSFSGKVTDALNNIILSKEVTDIKGYMGPKYIKLNNMEILD